MLESLEVPSVGCPPYGAAGNTADSDYMMNEQAGFASGMWKRKIVSSQHSSPQEFFGGGSAAQFEFGNS